MGLLIFYYRLLQIEDRLKKHNLSWFWKYYEILDLEYSDGFDDRIVKIMEEYNFILMSSKMKYAIMRMRKLKELGATSQKLTI